MSVDCRLFGNDRMIMYIFGLGVVHDIFFLFGLG